MQSSPFARYFFPEAQNCQNSDRTHWQHPKADRCMRYITSVFVLNRWDLIIHWFDLALILKPTFKCLVKGKKDPNLISYLSWPPLLFHWLIVISSSSSGKYMIRSLNEDARGKTSKKIGEPLLKYTFPFKNSVPLLQWPRAGVVDRHPPWRSIQALLVVATQGWDRLLLTLPLHFN